MKEYYKKNSDKMKKQANNWRIKNPISSIKYKITKIAYQKRVNYKYEKTEKERESRNIKRKTRYYFSLEGINCEYCGKSAQCRHHNTNPIKFDKFDFVCNKCHKIIHDNLNANMEAKK